MKTPIKDALIRDVEAYSAAVGVKPQTVLRRACGAGWGAWNAWLSEKSSPTVEVADRIYAYMGISPTRPAQMPPHQQDVA